MDLIHIKQESKGSQNHEHKTFLVRNHNAHRSYFGPGCMCSRSAAGKKSPMEKLLGSWTADITTPNQGTFPALLTFTSDGIVMAAEYPLPFEGSGHGSWTTKSSGEVAYTLACWHAAKRLWQRWLVRSLQDRCI